MDEFYRITRNQQVFNDLLVKMKGEEVDIVEVSETIEEIGEELGLEWKIG